MLRSVACTSKSNENALEVSDLTKLNSDKPEPPWKQRDGWGQCSATEVPCRWVLLNCSLVPLGHPPVHVKRLNVSFVIL